MNKEEKTTQQIEVENTIRQLLWDCIHACIPIVALCEMVMRYIPHSAVRACSLLRNPFSVVDIQVLALPCQSFDESTFFVGADGVGKDVAVLNQPRTANQLKIPCGPPVRLSQDWTIEMKIQSENKNELVVDKFTLISTRKDTEGKSVVHSELVQSTRPRSYLRKVPRMSLSPDKKTLCYITNSTFSLEGKVWTEERIEFITKNDTKTKKPLVIKKPYEKHMIVPLHPRVDWLHGNHHVALEHNRSLLVVHVSDSCEHKADFSASENILVMSVEEMDYSWSHRLVHEFPVIFSDEGALSAAHPTKNQFIVYMKYDFWLIAYRENTWWIVCQFDNRRDMYMQWSLLGTHLIFDDLKDDSVYSIVADPEKKTILHENIVVESRSNIDIHIIENDPGAEYSILRRIASERGTETNTHFHFKEKKVELCKRETSGPFFLLQSASQIYIFCRETGELLQVLQFDGSNETCVACTWNLTKTRLFVLVRDHVSQLYRFLVFSNTDFEDLFRKKYVRYPISVNCKPLISNDDPEIKFLGFFL